MKKNCFIFFLSLLFFSCSGSDDEVQPKQEPEMPTEQPAGETTSGDPVEVDGAPMKVMTLSHEDFMRLFVGKKWVRCPQLTISKDGKFSICDLTGFYSADMVVESEETVIAEGVNAADEPYTSRRSFRYDEQTGCLLFPNGLPAFVGFNKSVRVALLNEECLMAFENKEGRGSFGDYIVYMFRNSDESTLHQPVPRKAESVFPFKMSLDKKTFAKDILTAYTWSPMVTLGVFDDGTVAPTTLNSLKDTYLAFGDDGIMKEYFIDSKSGKRSWHNCPYTYDAETGTVTFREGSSPTPFRAYADRVQAFSSWGFNGVLGMMGLAVNTQDKSRFNQIVCIFYGCSLNYVKDWEQTAAELPFEE